MRILVLLSLLALVVSAVAQTRLYRWVDEQGRVHYSDRPGPAAETIEVPKAQTYRPPPQPAAEPPPPRPAQPPPAAAPVAYETVAIVTPAPEQTLWNIGGTLPVSLSVVPGLGEGHSIRVSYDGQPVTDWPPAALSFTLGEVWRGAHTLRMQIVAADGSVVASAEPVTFYVQQSSVLN